MKIILITLIIFVLVSCQKEHKHFDYYESGEIKGVFYYPNKNDKKTFNVEIYTKEGILYKKLNYINGLLEGENLFYDSTLNRRIYENYQNNKLEGKTFSFEGDKKVEEQTFCKGILHGITRVEFLLEDSSLIRNELLYLKGRKVLTKVFYSENNFNIVENVLGKDRFPNGSIMIDKRGEIVQNESLYYVINEFNDTIRNDSITFKVELLNNLDWKLQVIIGDLNNDLEITDTIINKRSDNKDISITIPNNYKQGWDLVLGKVIFIPNSKLTNKIGKREYVLYKEFYNMK